MRSLTQWAQRNNPPARPKRRKVGPDFHLVQLTAEGRALAGGTPLRISNGRISVLFPADGEPVKVARFEWDMLLRDHAHIDGSQLSEIVKLDDEEDFEVESADRAEENE